ncbi:MAG: hypothetical protein K9J06_06740 [Flavobacteriales bacterium]|nr:hypothetical protein [Flavobacteriales bacterium]
MTHATLAQLRKELGTRDRHELAALCLRLAKFKKDNKELLHYLLFGSENEERYLTDVKAELADVFASVNPSTPYLAKKTIRRALRMLDRFARYSSIPETEIELLLFFCERFNALGRNIRTDRTLQNLYQRQLVRIGKLVGTLHPDLQHDYALRIERLGH